LDGTPEAWVGFGLVISLSKKAGSEEIVGKNASLEQAIAALANLEVDPTIKIATLKFVLLNKFCRNVCNFNVDIFRVRHWSIEVEILEINGAETWPGQENTLLRRSLNSLRDAVLVPTLPRKQMQLPPMVMRV
jgi:hypothetical protein